MVDTTQIASMDHMVAGLGFRPLVKQDYEPCKILTFHPQINEQGYSSTNEPGEQLLRYNNGVWRGSSAG